MSQERSPDLLRDVAKRNARIEILEAFECWHLEHGDALHAAMKEWRAFYGGTGAGVSKNTRAVIPSLAWNTLRRYRRKRRTNGDETLLPAKGGRRSIIGAGSDMRDLAEQMLSADPANALARDVQQVLMEGPPDEPSPASRLSVNSFAACALIIAKTGTACLAAHRRHMQGNKCGTFRLEMIGQHDQISRSGSLIGS